MIAETGTAVLAIDIQSFCLQWYILYERPKPNLSDQCIRNGFQVSPSLMFQS
jgi:hypothetical protein